MRSVVSIQIYDDEDWRHKGEATIETRGTWRVLSQTSYAIGEATANALAALVKDAEEADKKVQESALSPEQL